VRRTGGSCQGARFTLEYSSFHCLIHGRESTNAGVVAFRCRVLTGLHRAPYSNCQGADCQGAYALAVAARPLATAKGAGPPWQRPLFNPDPQAQRGSGPGDGPVARQPLGGVVCSGGPCLQQLQIASNPGVPPKASPPLLQARSRAHSTMCLASSPHDHLRPSTAHYVARRSAPNLRHFSALATRCTPLFYPQDPSFPPPSCGHVYPQMRAFGDKRHPAHPALVQHSEFCPPFTPALPDVVSAERGAYLGIADFPGALPRPGRATRFSTPEPSPAGAGNSSP
jgi:hypothetical protein